MQRFGSSWRQTTWRQGMRVTHRFFPTRMFHLVSSGVGPCQGRRRRRIAQGRRNVQCRQHPDIRGASVRRVAILSVRPICAATDGRRGAVWMQRAVRGAAARRTSATGPCGGCSTNSRVASDENQARLARASAGFPASVRRRVLRSLITDSVQVQHQRGWV
jgi:hypothetical protein